MWKKLRISILLFILFLVGADTYMSKYRAVSWDETLWVAVYPINSTNDPEIDRYIANLSNRNFAPIEHFFKREADEKGLVIEQPFRMMLAHTVYELPPEPPGRDSNVLEIALWSLKLRYWAWSQDHSDFSPHIKVFVIFHDYNQNKKLAHSLGMEKGMIGVVHGFAHREMEGKNNLVIAHEILHTIGATDKYHPENGEPVYPDGFAEPDRSPRFPQRFTELMGGRTPINETTSIMPRNLNSVKVGKVTAQEINWFSQ